MKKTTILFEFLLILLSGISIGWLVGLSVSPVIASVIAVLLSMILGLSKPLQKTVPNNSFKFISFLIISISIGATAGLYTRINNLLKNDTSLKTQEWICDKSINQKYIVEEINFWAKNGMEKKAIVEQLFLAYINKCNNIKAEKEDSSEKSMGGLYSYNISECKQLQNLPNSELKNSLKVSKSIIFKVLGDSNSNIKDIRISIEKICKK